MDLPEEWEGPPANEQDKVEEIKRLTVNENLSEIERATTLLTGGHPLQQRSVIDSFPALIKAKGKLGYIAVAPCLARLLPTFDIEGQVAIAEALRAVAREKLLAHAELVECMLPLVLSNISSNTLPDEVMDAWIRTFIHLVPALDKAIIKGKILSLALSKAEIGDTSVQSRVVCCALLGAIAPRMTKEEVEASFLRKAMSLCQDTDYIVRICMADQLSGIAHAVGREVTAATILPEILELIKDEEVLVRAAALSCLLAVMEGLPADLRKAKVLPFLRQQCQSLDLDVDMQRCLARLFGPIITKVVAEVDNDQEVGIFLGCYRTLASRPDVHCRLLCATSFATVLKAATPRRYATHLHDTLIQLVSDADESIRVAIASQFHEVARMLGKERCQQYSKRPFLNLLHDDSSAVRAAVTKMLPVTLDQFQTGNEEQRTRTFAEILPEILAVEANCGRDWRLQLDLMLAFPSFTQVFSSDQVYEHFLPLAFKYMGNGVAPVKFAAADAAAAFLRHNRKQAQRTDIYARLVRDFARSKCCFRRMTFVDACQHLMRRYSTKFFKEFFLDLCIDLLNDPIPNVRLHVCQLMPILKQTIRLPEDVEQLERLNSGMSNLTTDPDRDVAAAALAVNDAFKRTPVRMTGSAGGLDMNGLPSGVHEFESEDKRKEEEEAELTFSMDDLEKIKADEGLDKRRRGGAGGDGARDAGGANARRVGKPNALDSRPISKTRSAGTASTSAGSSSNAKHSTPSYTSSADASTSSRPGAAAYPSPNISRSRSGANGPSSSSNSSSSSSSSHTPDDPHWTIRAGRTSGDYSRPVARLGRVSSDMESQVARIGASNADKAGTSKAGKGGSVERCGSSNLNLSASMASLKISPTAVPKSMSRSSTSAAAASSAKGAPLMVVKPRAASATSAASRSPVSPNAAKRR
ncbi:hypothetical protein WJX72_002412 [[Myrmecia] bisecta]|uniref:Serine/threonine-protein phosphatase 4 regulatory subunit 4 n=1 Tax=[Myrmecia] bisecta TaxID=41462 RepID=A0AAW1QEF0_9CHLO